MTLKTPMNKKKKRFYKLMLSQLRYDDLPEVSDHLAHILEMENEKFEPEDKLFDIFSDPAKYASVDKDHSYLTSPKVIMVSPATDVDKRKKGTPGRKKAVSPKKATPKTLAPETPSQITRSGRAVKANKRFMEMEMLSDEDEEVEAESEAEISEDEPEEPEPQPVKRGRGRPPKNASAKAKQKESDEMVIGSITMMEDEKGKRRSTRGSLSKGDEYLVKGKPKVIRKPKDTDESGSRKRSHSQVDDEKASSAKKSKVSDIVDRITSKRDAKKSDEEDEGEEEEEAGDGSSEKSDKIDPYSPDFSVSDFVTCLKDGKKSSKGWKKADETGKAGQKKSGRGWVKINSDSKKDDEDDVDFDLTEEGRAKSKQGYPCDNDQCGKRFISKQSLAAHQQTHNGEKPFKCGVCGQRFKQKAHIGPHMLTHTGEKSFECQFCFTKFRQKSTMTEHIKRVHSDGNKPHICELCPIGFWSQGALKHHMKAAHKTESPSRPKTPPPKREIILPPPAQPEPVNLFEGKYVCSLCDEKYDEMMDLADHVKTHMTQLDEETEMKNAQIAAEAKAQAIEREQIALRELEEANRLAAERAAAGVEEPKEQLDIPGIMHKTRGVPIRIPAGVLAGTSRGSPKAGSSKVPLENVVISTPSGLKFTIKASPQALKGSKYKLAAVPLKGLSQHLKSGVLKLAPSAGGGKLLAGAKGSPQQIKMKILGGEGDGSVLMSSTPGTAGMQGTILDLKDITKTAADISGVASQPGDEMISAPTFTTSIVGNDTVISMQPKAEPPPPPPAPAADQTYYQCGDCSALFETMDAIQAHLQNDCAGANQAAAQASAAVTAAVAQDAMPVDNLGSIPSVDASDMTGTTTIDLGQQIAPGTSLITESGTVIANPNIGEGGFINTDPTGTVPMSVAFDAGLQVMATAAGMTSLAPTSLEDPNEAVAAPENQQFEPEHTNEVSEPPMEGEPEAEGQPLPEEGMVDDENAGSNASVHDPNSEAVSEASAELAGSVSGGAMDPESTEGGVPDENVPVDGVDDGTAGEQPMETADDEPQAAEEMLEMPVAGDEKENVADTEGIPSTSEENIGVTQILNIPGMDTTQSMIQSMPGTTVPYEGQKMISILNQPGVVQSQNGQGDGLEEQNSGIITTDGANEANFENVVLGQSGDGSIVQTQEGEQLTLVDQSQAVTLPDGQQIVTYMDDSGQLAGNGAQQIQVVTTESGETYQIALPEGAASQGPMQYVTEDGQILTVKGSDLAANQGEYMVVDNGNLGGVPVTQASDNVQYVVYTSSS